jgi:hypothetical protein
MNSIASPGTLNCGRASADHEEVGGTADVLDSIRTMLEGVRDFAERALKEQRAGGVYRDEAAEVCDPIGDAIGKARDAESKISE